MYFDKKLIYLYQEKTTGIPIHARPQDIDNILHTRNPNNFLK